jgi:hypothetical protein
MNTATAAPGTECFFKRLGTVIFIQDFIFFISNLIIKEKKLGRVYKLFFPKMVEVIRFKHLDDHLRHQRQRFLDYLPNRKDTDINNI